MVNNNKGNILTIIDEVAKLYEELYKIFKDLKKTKTDQGYFSELQLDSILNTLKNAAINFNKKDEENYEDMIKYLREKILYILDVDRKLDGAFVMGVKNGRKMKEIQIQISNLNSKLRDIYQKMSGQSFHL